MDRCHYINLLSYIVSFRIYEPSSSCCAVLWDDSLLGSCSRLLNKLEMSLLLTLSSLLSLHKN
jgi:hypothetical protein